MLGFCRGNFGRGIDRQTDRYAISTNRPTSLGTNSELNFSASQVPGTMSDTEQIFAGNRDSKGNHPKLDSYISPIKGNYKITQL